MRRSQVMKLYQDYKQRIDAISQQQASKWNRDSKDIRVEVIHAFIVACDTWREDGGANFNTWFNSILHNTILKYVARHDIPPPFFSPAHEEDADTPIQYEGESRHGEFNPAVMAEFRDELEHLSDDAQMIVTTILNHPNDFLKSSRHDLPPNKIRGALKRWLMHDQQWSGPRVYNAFRELRELAL